MTQDDVLIPEGECLPESGMEFRLTYDGELLSASKSKGRVAHKHTIRRVFHRQLRDLWRDHPALHFMKPGSAPEADLFDRRIAPYARDGFRWAPLALKQLVTCELEVLILRRGPPGNFVAAGDIDGQVKTIFDALQIPEADVLPAKGLVPEDGEDPFFCLLEDDALIVKAAIETDSLLGPLHIDGRIFEERKNDARVVIKVTTKRSFDAPY